ncbi:MAG: response regulator [Anaerolineae bacterium]
MTKSTPFILSIESDENCRLILSKLLVQIMGFDKTQIWADSSDFLDRINELPEVPQLVLLDINVAPLSGYKMLKLLHENANFEKTKLVAFTAGVMPEEINNLKNAGFDSLISKPIIRSNFPNIIKSIIDGQSIWYIS